MSTPKRVIKIQVNEGERLIDMPRKMMEAAVEALVSQARLVVGLAQVYVPVDTGSLRDSIRVERGGACVRWCTVRVRAGGYITNPKTKRLVDYAAIVEAKQHFMQRAWEEITPDIRDVIDVRVYEAMQTGH